MVSRNASFRDDVLTAVLLAPLWVLLKTFVIGAGVLLLAWMIDGVLVLKIWPEGVGRLKALSELEYAQGSALAGRLGLEQAFFHRSANSVYEFIFGLTGVHEMALRFADTVPLSVPDTVLRRLYVENWKAIEVAAVSTQLIGVRVAIAVLCLPAALLGYFIAVADGLAQRSIRRAAGGRESASLYHRAKHMQVAVAGIGFVTVLVWPTPVNWTLTAIVMSAVVAMLARIQWAYYKKHL
jgi:hypothetical protein